MSTYQPEPSSVAARVIAYLQKQPPGVVPTNADLSHALGVPASSFSGCLNLAVNAGLLHKRMVEMGRTVGWALGPLDGADVPPSLPVPSSQPATPPETDEQPSQTRVTIHPPMPAAEVELVQQIEKACPDPSSSAPSDPAFACALFNDGRLYLELGDETMTLQVEHTRSLLAYLERVAMP
jgi:hypothetical protein